jgi:hypothetical protein
MSSQEGNPSWLERTGANIVAHFDQRLSRRSVVRATERLLLTALGVMVVPEMPLLQKYSKTKAMDPSCNCHPWYLCGIYGTLCCQSASCASGCNTGCPQGGVASSYWTACCSDGTSNHLIYYYDCCQGIGQGLDCDTCPGCYNGSSQPAWCPDNYLYLCTITSDRGESC